MRINISFGLAMMLIAGLASAQFVQVPGDYLDINDAIQNAGSGTAVIIAPGVYDRTTQTFPIVMRDRVSLEGSGIYNTIIDATGSGATTATVVMRDIISTATALSDVTIQGGTGTLGGALLVRDSQLALIHNCRFLSNSASQNGGGVCIIDSSIFLYDNIVEDNTAPDGGGIYVGGATSQPTILRNVVKGNRAQRGGGIAVNAAQGAELFSNTFDGNVATQSGGALYLEQSDCMVDSNDVTGNSAGLGGGFYCLLDSSRAGKNTVLLNSASAGAGFYLDSCSGAIFANEIARNTASSGSAALYSTNGSEEIINNAIWGNVGGVGQIVDLRQCVNVRFVNNTVARNEVTTSSLSGAVGFSDGTLRFYNDIIALNVGTGYVEGNASSDAEFYNNLLWGNTDGNYLDEGTTVYDTAADINTFVTNAGDNITSDPEFVNVLLNDFHVLPISPAKENAYWFAPSRPAEDFDGDVRPPFAAADTDVDIGMDEVTRPTLAAPPLCFDMDASQNVSAGDMLVLLFDRAVAVNPPLVPGDFFLPVSGDSLGSSINAGLNPDNPREVRVSLGSGAQLTVSDYFSFDHVQAGDPTGMDLSPWIRSDAIVDEWGLGAVHSGTAATTDSALDLKPAIKEVSYDLFRYSGGLLQAADEGLLTNTQLFIPFSSLIADATITLRQPYDAFRSITTTVFESTTINTLFEPEHPATLSLEYYPAEWDLEDGERIENLRVHQAIETTPGSYRWDVVEDAFGDIQSLDTENHLVSVKINRLLPITGAFAGAGAGVQQQGKRPAAELPTNGIYALLPLEVIQEDSITIAQDVPGPPPSTAVLSAGSAGGYTKHRIEIPGYHEAASGVNVTMRRARLIERSAFLNDSNAVFSIETVDSATGDPVDFNVPFNVRVEYKDRGSSPWRSDVVDMENIPAFESQMRLVRYNLGTQAFDFIATGTAQVNPLENTVTVQGVSGLTRNGLGVWGVVASPQIAAQNTFEQNEEYWRFGGAYPVFDLPQTGIGAGAIWLTAQTFDTFGFWYSPLDACPVVPDSIYRGTMRISTDVADGTRVPGFRVRFTPQNLQKTAYLVIASAGAGDSSPTPSGVNYTLYYAPPESALGATEDEDDFGAAFDILHFDPADQMIATLRLENFQMDRIALEDVGTFSLVRSYSFDASTEAWSFGGAPPTFTLPVGSYVGGTLRLQTADTNTFGFWTATTDVVLETGRLYKAVFRAKSNLRDYEMAPEMRLRMGGSNQQFTSCLSISSVGDAESSPNRNYRDYAVYLYPPQNGIAGGSVQLILALDLLNFTLEDDPAGMLILDRVDVYRASASPVP